MSQVILSNSSSPLYQALTKESQSISPYVYGLPPVFANSATLFSTTTSSGGIGFGRELEFPIP